MTNQNQVLYGKIRDAVISGIRKCGESIFALSQETSKCFVPTQTGFLKHSGYVKDLTDGIEIGYTAPYASDVELGFSRRPIQGGKDITLTIKKHTRRAHLRHINGRTIFVKQAEIPEHQATFKNAKIVTWRPKLSKYDYGKSITRILTHEGPRKGQFFLSRAFDERIKELPKLIEVSLKRIT